MSLDFWDYLSPNNFFLENGVFTHVLDLSLIPTISRGSQPQTTTKKQQRLAALTARCRNQEFSLTRGQLLTIFADCEE
jgi:hypothetical protein